MKEGKERQWPILWKHGSKGRKNARTASSEQKENQGHVARDAKD